MQNSCSASSVSLCLPLCVLVSHRYNGDHEHTYCMRLKDSLHIKQLLQCLVDRKTYRLPTIITVIITTNFMDVINAAHHIFSALCFLAPLGWGGAICIVLAIELWAEVHMWYLWHAIARPTPSELSYSEMGASDIWNSGYSISLEISLLDPQSTSSKSTN